MDRNFAIFEDRKPSAIRVVTLVAIALDSYASQEKAPAMRNIVIKNEVKGATGWFDGAAEATRLNSGAGGIIKTRDNRIYKWTLNCGPGSNTRAELMGAWALLTLASRLFINDLHVKGDSMIVINWLRDKGRLQVISLECWKDRLVDLIKLFQHISFDHVYRDDNSEADNLSKQALQKQPGKIFYFQSVEEHEGPPLSIELF
jgi:ribonuclease HI